MPRLRRPLTGGGGRFLPEALLVEDCQRDVRPTSHPLCRNRLFWPRFRPIGWDRILREQDPARTLDTLHLVSWPQGAERGAPSGLARGAAPRGGERAGDRGGRPRV